MDTMTLTPQDVKDMLVVGGAGPNKSLGQNFLVDGRIIKQIVSKTDSRLPLLEIGSGLGAVTIPLARKVAQLQALEIDPKMILLLKKRLEWLGVTNVEIVQQDILKFSPDQVPHPTFQVFSSLPYYITSPIIHKLLIDFRGRISQMILMMQKEVAVKITTPPPRGSYWYHLVHCFYDVEVIVKKVQRSSFWPQPNVESQLLLFSVKVTTNGVDPVEWSDFLHTVFKNPRKKLRNSMSEQYLAQASIDPNKRPGEIREEELKRLFGIGSLTENTIPT